MDYGNITIKSSKLRNTMIGLATAVMTLVPQVATSSQQKIETQRQEQSCVDYSKENLAIKAYYLTENSDSSSIDNKQAKQLKLTENQFNALDALDGSTDGQIDKSVYKYANKYRHNGYKISAQKYQKYGEFSTRIKTEKEFQTINIMSSVTVFYENGGLQSVARDRNHDNVIDEIEYFYENKESSENGGVNKRYKDYNFDGKMDEMVEFYKSGKMKKIIQQNNGQIETYIFYGDGTRHKSIGSEADLKPDMKLKLN